MSDVTFVRGYGFPRGASMDYAGYSGHAGGCGGNCGCAGCGPRRMSGFSRAVRSPEAGLFATIPALDGYNETEGSVELTRGPVTMSQDEMVLPTLDVATGKWYDDQGREVDPSTGAPMAGSGGLFALLGIGLIGAAFFWK